ncbi:MAG: ankyrin repeat domain-containing protein [Candidatus Omnitrophica bacterium]|nr:ankyrin repeat domain-containing protein [Candidatus Omnitrophota bacterium]
MPAPKKRISRFRKILYFGVAPLLALVLCIGTIVFNSVPHSTFRSIALYYHPYDESRWPERWGLCGEDVREENRIHRYFGFGLYFGTIGVHWTVDQRLIEQAYFGELEEARRLLEEDPTLIRARNEIGESALRLAVEGDDLPFVKLSVERGADINEQWFGDTPLSWALLNKRDEMADLLLSLGAEYDLQAAARRGDANRVKDLLADTHILDKGGKGYYRKGGKGYSDWPALVMEEAIHGGNPQVVKELLDAGIPIDAVSQYQTPLATAARAGDATMVEFLISEGASIGLSKGPFGDSALLLAVRSGSIETASTLLSAATDVNGKKSEGLWTPLTCALFTQDSEMLRFLIQQGADVNLKDKLGNTPLHEAIGKPDLVQILIESGTDINGKNKRGETPLEYALYLRALMNGPNGSDALDEHEYHRTRILLRAILEQGSDLRGRNVDEDPVSGISQSIEILKKHGGVYAENLLNAILERRSDLMRKILKEDPDLASARIESSFEEDYNGHPSRYPTHLCALTGFKEGLQILMEFGADINQVEGQSLGWGETPLSLALAWGHPDLADFIRSQGGTYRPTIRNALLDMNLKLLEDILEKEPERLDSKKDWRYPLGSAIRLGWIDAVKLLLSKGGLAPWSQYPDAFDWTPFHAAAGKGDIEILELLLNHNLENVNNGDKLEPLLQETIWSFDIPVSIAVSRGRVDMIEYLLDLGLPPDTAGRNSPTLLAVAVIHNETETAELLLQRGADPTRKHRLQSSALDLAQKIEDPTMLDLIKRYRPSLSD